MLKVYVSQSIPIAPREVHAVVPSLKKCNTVNVEPGP